MKSGQILISRANITRLVGATALVGTTRDKLMLCDKIFRVIPLDPAPVDPAFLAEVLRIPDVRRQIESRTSQGHRPRWKNISKPALLGLTFPLPPEPEQQKMVEALADARKKAATLRETACRARAQAWTDVEAAIHTSEDAEEAAELIAAAVA